MNGVSGGVWNSMYEGLGSVAFRQKNTSLQLGAMSRRKPERAGGSGGAGRENAIVPSTPSVRLPASASVSMAAQTCHGVI